MNKNCSLCYFQVLPPGGSQLSESVSDHSSLCLRLRHVLCWLHRVRLELLLHASASSDCISSCLIAVISIPGFKVRALPLFSLQPHDGDNTEDHQPGVWDPRWSVCWSWWKVHIICSKLQLSFNFISLVQEWLEKRNIWLQDRRFWRLGLFHWLCCFH